MRRRKVATGMCKMCKRKREKDETRFERVTYRTAAGCSTPELFVLFGVLMAVRAARWAYGRVSLPGLHGLLLPNPAINKGRP